MSDTKDPEKQERPKIIIWTQWLAACAVSLAPIVSGLANGWTSPYLAQLTSTTADVSTKLTENEASWIASLLNLGRVFGALIGAVIQEYVGRKKQLVIGGLPLALSWVFSICATSVTWLYISRFCSGIGSGMVWLSLVLYLGEIADPKIRGALISMNVNAASVGMFLGNVMGPYLSMEMFAYVSLVPNILFMALVSLIPESPYHYVLHGDIDKAEASLKWFRREADVKAEMRELQDFVDGAESSIIMRLKSFILPGNLKKVIILFILNVFVHASGYATINAYAEIIVIKSGMNLTASVVVMILGFATIIAGTSATVIVDRFGRRSLLMISGLGVAISLGLLGLHFHILSIGIESSILEWLPLTSMLCYNIFLACGFVSVPGALLGEMFPADLKTLASLLLGCGNAMLSFISTKSFQPFIDLIGEKFVFWSFGFIVLSCVPYVYYFIPETKGKSLLQIQKSIKK
ncbi:facilitated trehalose transporter Tret1-like [Polistes fuscatus]|uniref:facilitated trehalose transporter Tret1-like n=1 Tax=Polistes fuscatus TaxID=30207 RepID=UPI001CA9753B|nr:facilitated trehalose transporter Tret1-like [Polistes fuscatus]